MTRARPASSAAAAAPPGRAPTSPLTERALSGSSAERSLRVLTLLADEGRPLSLAELAARLALP
jgi:hypothetical protein